MKIAQLKKLLKQGESERLEFKNSTGSLTSAMQTVCALLNSEQGGLIIFGVKDDGKIVGQKVTDKTRKDIAAELNKIEPFQKILVEYIAVDDDRQVIVFAVEPSEQQPC